MEKNRTFINIEIDLVQGELPFYCALVRALKELECYVGNEIQSVNVQTVGVEDDD